MKWAKTNNKGNVLKRLFFYIISLSICLVGLSGNGFASTKIEMDSRINSDISFIQKNLMNLDEKENLKKIVWDLVELYENEIVIISSKKDFSCKTDKLIKAFSIDTKSGDYFVDRAIMLAKSKVKKLASKRNFKISDVKCVARATAQAR